MKICCTRYEKKKLLDIMLTSNKCFIDAECILWDGEADCASCIEKNVKWDITEELTSVSICPNCKAEYRSAPDCEEFYCTLCGVPLKRVEDND